MEQVVYGGVENHIHEGIIDGFNNQDVIKILYDCEDLYDVERRLDKDQLQKYYFITIADKNGKESIVPEVYTKRDNARWYIAGSDARYCYYQIYKFDGEKFLLTDKIWNFI